MKLKDYLEEVDSLYIQQANLRYDEIEKLDNFLSENSINADSRVLLKEHDYKSDNVINEFLRSVDPSIIIHMLKKNFSSIDVFDENGLVTVLYNTNITDNIVFKYILSICNYRIHTNHIFKRYMILEKVLPEPVPKKFNKLYHITDQENVEYIKEHGLRPKYCKEKLEKHLKLYNDKYNNNFAKIYFIGLDRISRDNIKDAIEKVETAIYYKKDYVVFEIIPPYNITLYKDEMMVGSNLSYYTYNAIPYDKNKFKIIEF